MRCTFAKFCQASPYWRAARAIEKIRSTLGPSIDVPTAGTGAFPVPLQVAWLRLWERIHAAEQRYHRGAGSVALLAVSKAFAPATISAAAALGQRAFGENYAQEALAKIAALREQAGMPALQWHFIGPIQSNKTRAIAGNFDWVQSIERLSVARRLSEQRPAHLAPLEVLIEVNISAQASKSGIEPDELAQLAQQLVELPRLRLRGIMAIPAPGLAPADQRAAFARLRTLFESLRGAVAGAASQTAAGAGTAPVIDTLSMGMSADFEAAIAEGATMIRVGSALFGERP